MPDRDPFTNALAGDAYTTADVLGNMQKPSLADVVRNFFAAPRMQQIPRLPKGELVPSPMGPIGDALKSWSNTPGAITNALGMIPEDVSMAMNFVVPGAKIPPRISNPIKAYHGSPHDFDRFSMDKIGTGEGAQAYGHGLYFAEKEGVARSYKNALSDEHAWNQAPDTIAKAYVDAWGSTEAAIAKARQHLIDGAGMSPAQRANVSQAVNLLKANADLAGAKPLGRMYEVALHATPDSFLDWDKPLSGQSPMVRQALEPFGFKTDAAGTKAFNDALMAALEGDASAALPKQPPNPSGEQILRTLNSRHGSTWLDPSKPGEAAAASRLQESGIPGIRYLDQGSRGAGQGTSNFVVWNPEIIEILRKYGIAGPAALGLANALSQESEAQ